MSCIHITPGPDVEISRKPAGDLWCFGCRKRLPHDWVIYDYDRSTYFDPVAVRECSGCGDDRTAFPGTWFVYEPVEEAS